MILSLKSRGSIIYKLYNKYFGRANYGCSKKGNRSKINTIMLQFKELIWKMLSAFWVKLNVLSIYWIGQNLKLFTTLKEQTPKVH